MARSSDRRISGSSKKARADAEHSFKSDMAEARETHRKLQKLLEDVKQGRLRTFDSEEAFAEMNKIRVMQDELVEKHLEVTQSHQRAAQSENPPTDWDQLDSLMANLHKVCDAVHHFQSQVLASHQTDTDQGCSVDKKE